MHIHYEWRGPEEPLDSPLVTAHHMGCHQIEDLIVRLSARGSFTFHDHVEGCYGESRWVAFGTFSKNLFHWTVRRENPSRHGFAFLSKTGEPLFCLGDGTNAAIKAFIAKKLTRIVEYMRQNPGKEVDLVDQAAEYQGPKHEYMGPCRCQEIASSKKATPFDWNKHTDGGKYPANCFKCSCGNGWYRGNSPEELWVQVGDPEAWYMLTKWNGVATETIAIDPESKTPLLVLERTLRARGLIPIG